VKNGIQRHGRRKRWINILTVTGLVVTLGIIVGTYWLQKPSGPASRPEPPELPKNVKQQLSGVTFRRFDNGRRLFVIHASRTLAFRENGATVLKDVTVEYFGQSGKRYDVLTTAEGEYNRLTGNLSTPGDVQLILNASPADIRGLGAKAGGSVKEPAPGAAARQPVYITTSKVTSQDHGTRLESTTPVHFHLGNVSGSARGLIYGSGKGEIILQHDVQAVFHLHKGLRPGAPIAVSARRLRFAGPGAGIQLWGPVKVNEGTRTVTASQGTITLNSHNRITEVRLAGHADARENTANGQLRLQSDVMQGDLDPATSRLVKLTAEGHVQARSKQAGALTQVEAHQVVLNFDPATHVPADGVAVGQVHLTIHQAQGAGKGSPGPSALGGKISGEDLATEKIQFTFRPGGKNLKAAETGGPGTLVLYPENPKAGDRTVTAGRFLMAFDPTSHLESLRGTGGTRVVFAPPPNSRNRLPAISTSHELLAEFDPATEMVRSVEQSGDFRFRNGTLQARGKQARDLAREQKLILTGSPEVWDSSTRAKANRIVILLATDRTEGIGGVHAIHTDPKDPSSPPTNVVADRMIADRRSQVVHYEGHVRAWRGTDVVESPSLDVYRNERRVSTNSPVVTSHLQPSSAKSGTKEGATGPHPLTIRANRLEYFDVGRRARYAGHVVMDTEDTRIDADQLDVYFSPGGKQGEAEVKRAVAKGHVKIVQPMRYAKGENAVYDAKTGKVIMTGGPPTVYDTEKGSMTGQRLTFFIHNDRVLVDGSVANPAVSKHRVAK